MPSVIPCSLSPLVSLIRSYLFSDWSVLSHRNSSTHEFPRFPLRNLCSFVTLAVLSLVFEATDTAYCQAVISLELAESRIFPAAPADTVPQHLSSHSALSSYGIFAALALWRLSVPIRPLFQALGSFPASGAPWFSAMPPSLGRGQVKTTTTTTIRSIELKL